MYPDRDVRRKTQFAGFMIILFWRPFPTPSGSLYPWNINWDGAALNLVPALIPVIHYHLTSFLFFLQQPPFAALVLGGESHLFPLVGRRWFRQSFCLRPPTASLLGSKTFRSAWRASCPGATWTKFCTFLLQKRPERRWEARLIESLLRPRRP